LLGQFVRTLSEDVGALSEGDIKRISKAFPVAGLMTDTEATARQGFQTIADILIEKRQAFGGSPGTLPQWEKFSAPPDMNTSSPVPSGASALSPEDQADLERLRREQSGLQGGF
jgi:hypothetical protein